MSPAKSRRLQGSRGRTLSKMWAGALLLTGLFASGIALAESDPWRDWDGWADTSFTPLQLSLIGGPTQIFKEKVPVLGLRLSGLYANQSTVKGLDLGTLNRNDDRTGLGVGLAFGRGPLKTSCDASADLPEGRCRDCPLRRRSRCPEAQL